MKEINWIKEEGKNHRRELSGKQINAAVHIEAKGKAR